MAKGTLILLRHGQTTYNEKQLMCGQFDAPLTKLGEDQARLAGGILSSFAFDKIFSSSLSRAFNTASIALEPAAPDIEKRNELREMDAGTFAGRSLTDPEILAFPRDGSRALPGGESEHQFVARVKKFYEDDILPRMARGETVLVVSHAGVMHALGAIMNDEDTMKKSIWQGKRLPNTAVIVADYDEGKLSGQRLLEPPLPPAGDAFRPAM
ncbi:MAG: histidine phosphatase family protein [Alphaproteobacteria bacterium]